MMHDYSHSAVARDLLMAIESLRSTMRRIADKSAEPAVMSEQWRLEAQYLGAIVQQANAAIKAIQKALAANDEALANLPNQPEQRVTSALN